MKRVRRSEERGKADHGWLKSHHTFSFAEYYDPEYMGFGPLRVINEDRVAPGQGFGTHPHNNMEIFSYVISGELAHKDSMGNGRTIRAGELQAMSAGSGISHSEFNPSQTEQVHFLQIWITPNEKNLAPSYDEWKPTGSPASGLNLVVSPNGESNSLRVHQDALIYLGKLESGETSEHHTQLKRKVWIQMISGEIVVGEETLSSGDGLALTEESLLNIKALAQSSFLLFDLA